MDELVANCVIFFVAGYHTTATTLSLTTYFLALNQDVQDKLFKEMEEVLSETNVNRVTFHILSLNLIQNVSVKAFQ